MLVWLLFACTPGPAEGTTVDDVRVLAVQADPVEVAPGETGTLTATVVDPAGLGVELLVWTCTDLGDGCLEAAGPVDQWLTIAVPDDEQATFQRTAPPALASILGDALPALPVSTWALACPAEVCPLLEQARDALGAGSVSADLAAVLADPQPTMADLDFEEASLARRSWWVTSLPEEARNHAPLLSVEAPSSVAAGETIDLLVEADDPDEGDVPQAWGYATAGGFDAAQVPIAEGEAPLLYWAPEGAGEARLYVIADDQRGGQALWRGTITID